MLDKEWLDYYFRRRLREEERALADHDNAVAKYGLRAFHRDVNGERDVTAESRRRLEAAVDEYRKIVREAEGKGER